VLSGAAPYIYTVQGKGIVHPSICHEGPEKQLRYSCTLSLTSALDKVCGQRRTTAGFTSRKNPVPIVWDAGWAPGTVWTGAKELAPTGIRSPNRPARSESLYRLNYVYAVSLCMLDWNKSVIRLPVHPYGFKNHSKWPTSSSQTLENIPTCSWSLRCDVKAFSQDMKPVSVRTLPVVVMRYQFRTQEQLHGSSDFNLRLLVLISALLFLLGWLYLLIPSRRHHWRP
jgi:hypothetical protein